MRTTTTIGMRTLAAAVCMAGASSVALAQTPPPRPPVPAPVVVPAPHSRADVSGLGERRPDLTGILQAYLPALIAFCFCLWMASSALFISFGRFIIIFFIISIC